MAILEVHEGVKVSLIFLCFADCVFPILQESLSKEQRGSDDHSSVEVQYLIVLW